MHFWSSMHSLINFTSVVIWATFWWSFPNIFISLLHDVATVTADTVFSCIFNHWPILFLQHRKCYFQKLTKVKMKFVALSGFQLNIFLSQILRFIPLCPGSLHASCLIIIYVYSIFTFYQLIPGTWEGYEYRLKQNRNIFLNSLLSFFFKSFLFLLTFNNYFVILLHLRNIVVKFSQRQLIPKNVYIQIATWKCLE